MSIDVRNLAVEINNKLILDDVNISIPKNKITSIIGPNGAGKSTLLKAIGRINTSYTGQIVMDGYDISAFLVSIELRQEVQLISPGALPVGKKYHAKGVVVNYRFGTMPKPHGRIMDRNHLSCSEFKHFEAGFLRDAL